MSNYKHILIAIDFIEPCEAVIERAQDIATRNQATLSLIHVVENLPIVDTSHGYDMDMPFDFDLTTELIAIAKQKLAVLAEKLNIAKERLWLELGSPKTEIVRVAKENQIDLIVVGSHGRHGLALLLGSTANGVLHYAPCDVLAVRLQND